MLTANEAGARILQTISPLDVESVPLEESLTRFLAGDVTCPLDLPPFDNSGMDGYAVIAADTAGAGEASPVRLIVDGTIAAGDWWEQPLQHGRAVRIMTGAPVPSDANAVVMVEKTRADEDSVQILQEVKPGQNIRPRGEDVPRGWKVIERGTRLRPAEVGLLASMGFPQVDVHRRPSVVVVSTGDELVPTGQSLMPGGIYDSNSHAIASAARLAGAVIHARHHVNDQPEALRRYIVSVLPEVDAILTTGGVSVGDFDVVKAVIGDLGQINFWKVAMKPGKPLLFAFLEGKPMFGLPGNPVSAMVTFELFVRPALLKLQGSRSLKRPTVQTVLLEEYRSTSGREEYVRAKTTYDNARYQSRLCGAQGSGRLSSLTEANSLMVIPTEVTEVPVGSMLTAIMTDWEA